MKKIMMVLVMLVGLGQAGCEFIGGAAVGAGATGAGYEYRLSPNAAAGGGLQKRKNFSRRIRGA